MDANSEFVVKRIRIRDKKVGKFFQKRTITYDHVCALWIYR